MVRQLSTSDLEAFLAEKTAAAIHIDAAWDVGHRPVTRAKMIEAENVLADRASFGEIDCDRNAEWAKSLPLLGVPAVAYYRDSKLLATLLGTRQNIRARLERVLRGEPIGYKDGTDEVPYK
jgi:ABC-type uncharacterized transport system auxiliary subunit